MRLVVIVHLGIDEGIMDETKDFYKHFPSKFGMVLGTLVLSSLTPC
jgi:hypothetical protein